MHKKLSRWLKIDLNYVVRGIASILCDQVVLSVFGLAVSVLLARFWSVNAYGEYRHIIAFLSLFNIFMLGGMLTALTVSVAKGCDGDYGRIKSFIKKVSIIGSLGMYVTALTLHMTDMSSIVTIALLVMGAVFPVAAGSQVWAAVLKGKKQFELLTKYKIIKTIIVNITMIPIIVVLKDNVLLLVLIGSLVPIPIDVYLSRKIGGLISNNGMRDGAIRHGLVLTATGSLTVIARNIDSVIIGSTLGIAQLAHFAIGQSVFNVARMGAKAITGIAIPKAAEPKKVLILLNKRVIAVAILSLILLTLLLYVVAPQVIEWVYTEKYKESIDIAQKLILIIPFVCMSAFLNGLIISLGNTKDIVISRFLPQVLRLGVLSVLMVYRDVDLVIGAIAVEWVASSCVLMIVLVRKIRKVS